MVLVDKTERSANQYGHLILWNGCYHVSTLIEFKGQLSLLLQYEILEKLVTYIFDTRLEDKFITIKKL